MSAKQFVTSILPLLLPARPTIRRILSGPLRGTRFCAKYRIRPQYLLGQYEAEVMESIAQNLSSGQIAYDIGANVGFVSLLMAQAVSRDPQKRGAVYCFEPGPSAFRMLTTNALINPQFQIEPAQVALSDSSGIAKFSFFEYDLVSRLGDHKDNFSDAQITYVRVETLDDYVDQFHLPGPDFVKIDVEGSELPVLRGMRHILMSRHPTLLIEVHRPENSDEAAPDYGDEVVSYLSPLGYQCSFIQHQVPRQVLCRYSGS